MWPSPDRWGPVARTGPHRGRIQAAATGGSGIGGARVRGSDLRGPPSRVTSRAARVRHVMSGRAALTGGRSGTGGFEGQAAPGECGQGELTLHGGLHVESVPLGGRITDQLGGPVGQGALGGLP